MFFFKEDFVSNVLGIFLDPGPESRSVNQTLGSASSRFAGSGWTSSHPLPLKADGFLPFLV